jgi:hypothetical protein
MNMKKRYTKMTEAELGTATAGFNRPVGRKESRALTAAERKRWKRVATGPGRPKIGRGSVAVLMSLEMGLLERADRFAKAQGVGRSKLIAFALEAYWGRRQAISA